MKIEAQTLTRLTASRRGALAENSTSSGPEHTGLTSTITRATRETPPTALLEQLVQHLHQLGDVWKCRPVVGSSRRGVRFAEADVTARQVISARAGIRTQGRGSEEQRQQQGREGRRKDEQQPQQPTTQGRRTQEQGTQTKEEQHQQQGSVSRAPQQPKQKQEQPKQQSGTQGQGPGAQRPQSGREERDNRANERRQQREPTTQGRGSEEQRQPGPGRESREHPQQRPPQGAQGLGSQQHERSSSREHGQQQKERGGRVRHPAQKAEVARRNRMLLPQNSRNKAAVKAAARSRRNGANSRAKLLPNRRFKLADFHSQEQDPAW
jgi:hypothetical protein